MTLRLSIFALLLTALTAGASQQQDVLMRMAAGVRGTAVAPSVTGNAVDLNGVNEYFVDTASILSNATSVSICAWYKTTKLNAARILVHERSAGSSGFGIGIAALETSGGDANNGKIQGHYRDSSGVFRVCEGPIVTNNAWYFCAFVVSGTNGYLYHDGILTASVVNVSVSQSFPATAGLKTYIGYGITASAFSGLIDDLSVAKNRALSGAEVSELYASGNAKPFASLSTGTSGAVGYWTFNETFSASVTNAYDSISGRYAIGTGIGAGDTVEGKVPLP